MADTNDILNSEASIRAKITSEIQEEVDLSKQLVKIITDMGVEVNKITKSFTKKGEVIAEELLLQKQLEIALNKNKSLEMGIVDNAERILKAKQMMAMASRGETALLAEHADIIDRLTKLNNTDSPRELARLKEELVLHQELEKHYGSKATDLADFVKLQQEIVDEAENEILASKKSIAGRRSWMATVQAQLNNLTKTTQVMNGLTTTFGGSMLSALQNSNFAKGTGIAQFIGNLSSVKLLALAIFIGIIQKGFEIFKKYDEAAFNLRKSFGLMRGEADTLEKNLKAVTMQTVALGATFDDVQKTTSAIGETFNKYVAENKEMVRNITLFNTQLGISQQESSEFLKTISSVSNTTAEAQTGMMGFAKNMAVAAGIPLPKVMSAVAKANDDIRIFTGMSVVNLIKSVVQAKLMGTELDKVAATAKKLLDFNQSISDEMEASVLLGKNINLQRARELAYRKDIIGANKEIVNIAKQIDFDALDPFQAQAFATATGKSVKELQEMLQADKQIQYIRSQGSATARANLKMVEDAKRLSEEDAKNQGKLAEQMIAREANQTRMAALQNKFNELIYELSGPVMDILDPLLQIATAVLPVILKGIVPIFGIFKGISMVWNSISGFLNIGSKLGPLFGIIGKFLGPIGLVINAFQFLGGFFKGFSETNGNIFEKLWNGLLGGLKAVVMPIFDLLTWPFKKFMSWFSNESGLEGKSPSKLGEGILNGIISIGTMLFDALTAPFRLAFNFISGLFNGPKLKSLTEVTSDINVNSSNKLDESKIDSNSQLSTLVSSINESNARVVAKLDQLINSLESGKIAVNLDGSKVNYYLAKSARERGSLGAI